MNTANRKKQVALLREELEKLREAALKAARHQLDSRRRENGDDPGQKYRAIDWYCDNVARVLGKVLCSGQSGLCNPRHLAWVFGQYRGTWLTGRRALLDFFGPQDPNNGKAALLSWDEYLLRVYWLLYGIGASFGELFAAQVRESLEATGTESADEEHPVGFATWHALRVTLVKGEELTYKGPDWHARRGGRLLHFTLGVPRKWVPELLGDVWQTIWKGHTEARRDLGRCPANTEPDVQKADWDSRKDGCIHRILEEHGVGERLERLCSTLHASILARGWSKKEGKSVKVASSFLRDFPQDVTARLGSVLRAIQLLAMYWRWTEEGLRRDAGDLLVMAPVFPRGRRLPRLGFAFLFATKSTKCASRRKATEIARFLEETVWHTFEEERFAVSPIPAADPLQSYHETVGTANVQTLTKALATIGHEGDVAKLLLAPALALTTEVARLSPRFVHEHRRFGVQFLLGLPYHEQVIGRPLGPLRDYLDDIQDSEEDAPGTTRIMLKTLIHDTFSILDSPDVAVMAHYVPGRSHAFRLSSLLRILPDRSTLPTVERFKKITKGLTNLFAVCASRNGKVWLIAGGKAILEYSDGNWRAVPAARDLAGVLSFHFSNIKQLRCGSQKDTKKTLESFAQLLQQISEAGSGAMFIITPMRTSSPKRTGGAAYEEGEVDHAERNLGYVSEPPQCLWKSRTFGDLLGPQTPNLLQLAAMDGATVVEVSTTRGSFAERWAGARVRPRRVVCARVRFDKGTLVKLAEGGLRGWRECRSWGIRRASALAYAMSCQKQSLVVAVSADGPVYIMSGDAPYVTTFPPMPAGTE
jgi:hypothetical protein